MFEGYVHTAMKKSISILFITDLFEIMGGAERNITQLIRGLDRKKFTPILCCLRSGELADSLMNRGDRVIKLDIKRIYTPKALGKMILLAKLVKEEDVRLIITYHESSDFFGFALSKISKVPIISSKRDLGYKLNARHLYMYKMIGKYFNAAIVVSNAVKNEVIRRDKLPVDRILTIYNGVDATRYQVKSDVEKIKSDLGITAGVPVVGIIAGLRRIKGIKYFIEAIAVVKREKVDAQFIIIGNDPGEAGCSRSELEAYANELGVFSHVKFLGKRADIPEMLSIIDISVICSLSEGFSNTILESMAAGKPVVATDVGGNPESVIDGKNGFLIPPADSVALAKALIRLLEDEVLSDRMGKYALNRVKNKFSLEKMISENEDLYESVIRKYEAARCWWIEEKVSRFKHFLIQLIKIMLSGIVYYSGMLKTYLLIAGKLGKPACRIITYHNISDNYPMWLGINVDTLNFRKQIRFLKENYNIVNMEEALKLFEANKKHNNAIVITFDDAYKGFYTNVYPILCEYEVPATFFITVGPVNSGIPLHYDQLIYAIINTKFKFVDLSQLGLNGYFLDSISGKKRAISEISEHFKKIGNNESDELIKNIFCRLGVDFEGVKNTNQPINWSDIRNMKNDMIAFGSHTINHPNLAAISIEEADKELCMSKDILEKKINAGISFFSYPYGSMNNLNSKVIDLVKFCGYKGAVTLSNRTTSKINPFMMPRMTVNAGKYAGPCGGFSPSLFAVEISELSHYLFLRFLKHK